MNTVTKTPVKIFKDDLLTDMADKLKVEGMQVFYSPYNDNRLSTYFFFTDGENIGYCQSGYFGGLRFSTVHKPCRECGTGFGLTDDPGLFEPTIQDAKQAFIIAPNWASSKDRQAVRKYKNWDEYTSSSINKILSYLPY